MIQLFSLFTALSSPLPKTDYRTPRQIFRNTRTFEADPSVMFCAPFPSDRVFVLAPSTKPLGTLRALFWRGPGSCGVRGRNKQTSLGGGSWCWSDSCRGSEWVNDTVRFCFSEKHAAQCCVQSSASTIEPQRLLTCCWNRWMAHSWLVKVMTYAWIKNTIP